MNIIKKRIGYSNFELNRVNTMRHVWHTAKADKKVCLVSPREVTWEELLGNFYDVMYRYVESGMVYLRILNDDVDQVVVSDLDNELVEVGEAI